jgi:type III secretory pathway component EscR
MLLHEHHHNLENDEISIKLCAFEYFLLRCTFRTIELVLYLHFLILKLLNYKFNVSHCVCLRVCLLQLDATRLPGGCSR